MAELSEKAGKTWVLALTSVASFMVALDALVVTTALSTLRLDLGASIETLEWTVNAYNLSFAVLLLTGAALSAPALFPLSASLQRGGECLPRALRCSSWPRRRAHWRAISAH
jgi:MFS family permease